jgi:CheY-like chemotaxis protein
LAKDKKLSILVVEDNSMFIKIAEDMLSDHNVICVATGHEGIEQYIKNEPNITMLDIALPDMSGHDVLKEIKKLNENAYVIMLTASRLREDVLKSIDEGAEGYIMKPFSDEMIKQCIHDYYEYRDKNKW